MINSASLDFTVDERSSKPFADGSSSAQEPPAPKKRRGRPKALEADRRKQELRIAISDAEASLIDGYRGQTSRSQFVRQFILDRFSGEKPHWCTSYQMHQALLTHRLEIENLIVQPEHEGSRGLLVTLEEILRRLLRTLNGLPNQGTD